MQNQNKRYFTTSSGRIELYMSLQQAESVSGQGQQIENIRVLMKQQSIIDQTKNIDNNILVSELDEYGAWDVEQLSDHEDNLERLLWLAGCDISENTRTLKQEIQAEFPEYTNDYFSSHAPARHASDLQILLHDSAESATKLLCFLGTDYQFPKNIKQFISDVKGQDWFGKACIEIPFAANCPVSGKEGN